MRKGTKVTVDGRPGKLDREGSGGWFVTFKAKEPNTGAEIEETLFFPLPRIKVVPRKTRVVDEKQDTTR